MFPISRVPDLSFTVSTHYKTKQETLKIFCVDFQSGAMNKLGTIQQSMQLIVTMIFGIFFGFLIGISFPKLRVAQIEWSHCISSGVKHYNITQKQTMNSSCTTERNSSAQSMNNSSKIYISTNPKGAETLPPGIINSETDLYLRRLWGKPDEDLPFKQKYLVTFTVGVAQKRNIDAAIKKFSDNFTILLFHYDGKTSEWDEFEWSKKAIHVSARKQAKWWYAKRFLHPDIIAAYDYVFIWDEDLGVENFDAEEYIRLVKKYGLEISQPGLEAKGTLSWKLTKRNPDTEVHKETEEKPGVCSNQHLPPCAAFVEIMAPVFSRKAWRCAWHMIQSDLVHGWGLDLALRRCVEPAHEKIGIVDSQWVRHQLVPSLGGQGQANAGKKPWQVVRQRCNDEWNIFRARMRSAEIKYYRDNGMKPPKAVYGR